MAHLKIGDRVHGTVPGLVKAVLPDGWVQVEGEDGETYEAHVSTLTSTGTMMYQATGNVMGLLPDPPAAMARMARATGYPILPSPMAPETNKSGIVPDGKVKYLGPDGFLHEVPGASSYDDQVDMATVIVRED
jgi:hypothetical protein